MMRFIALTVVAAALVAVFVYGVVLNGFGLIEVTDRGQVAESTPAPAPVPETARTTDASPARDEAGSADTPLTESDPGVAGRGARLAEAEAEDRSQTAEVQPGQSAQTAPSTQPASDQPPSTDGRVARDVTPPNVLARPTSRYVDPAVVEAAKAKEEEEKPDVRRFHRVIVLDARTLEAGDKTIQLAGVSPIAADKTCSDESGQSWPCGRVAAAALRMLIRHRAIDCAVVSESENGIVGTCSAGLRDINGWLVEQGWAEADPGAGYTDEADAARSEKRGIYLARWDAKGQGGSGAVPQSSFTAPALPAQPYSGTQQPSDPQLPSAQAPLGEAPVQGLAN